MVGSKAFTFAKACPQTADELRKAIIQDVRHSVGASYYLQSMSKYTLMIPSDRMLIDDEVAIDKNTAELLQKFQILNWWSDRFPHFHPIKSDKGATVDDMCQAASVSMWGIGDVVLKDLLLKTLEEDYNGSKCLFNRWRGIIGTSKDIAQNEEEEWRSVTESVMNPRKSTSEIHIFTLANVIRRPIILTADSQLRGLYLPMLWAVERCHRSPLVISYQGGFVPVAASRPDERHLDLIPLANGSDVPLPVNCLTEEETLQGEALTGRYLDVVEHDFDAVHGTTTTTTTTTIGRVCKLNFEKIDDEMDMIVKYAEEKKEKLFEAEGLIILNDWAEMSIGIPPANWHRPKQEVVYDLLLSTEDESPKESVEEDDTKRRSNDAKLDFFARETAVVVVTDDDDDTHRKRPDGLSTALGKRSVMRRNRSLSDLQRFGGKSGTLFAAEGPQIDTTTPMRRRPRRTDVAYSPPRQRWSESDGSTVGEKCIEEEIEPAVPKGVGGVGATGGRGVDEAGGLGAKVKRRHDIPAIVIDES